MYNVPDLKPEARQHVLWLHQEAFHGLPKEELPCIPCGGKCCMGCGKAYGYLSDKNFKRVQKEYGFTKKDGFLGDTGCKLPPEERSVICLGYVCSGMKQSHALVPGFMGPVKEIDIPFNVHTIGCAEEIRQIGWDRNNYPALPTLPRMVE